jgi:hypothetical protein
MKVVTPISSLDSHEEKKSVEMKIFLAGGISNCPDWQSDMIKKFKESKHEKFLTLFNPRRSHINLKDETISQQQIKWEYEYLNKSDIILFWFPKESVCPISLFELGRWTGKQEKIVLVGVHPDYSRKIDIVEQMKLVRSDMQIVYSLDNLFQQTYNAAADMLGMKALDLLLDLHDRVT